MNIIRGIRNGESIIVGREEYEKILADIKEVLRIIVKEVNELKNKYGGLLMFVIIE